MKRFKITIQYDGSLFHGWQIQKNKRTVQGIIEDALSKTFKSESRIIVYGAGRTDSGVHAYGQVAHFNCFTNLNENILKKALNSRLELDCRVKLVELVENDFHSRYSALSRQYIYQCYIGNSILFRNQSWSLKKVKLNYLNILASKIIGTHDFLSYSKYNSDLKNTICKVENSRWMLDGDMIIFNVVSNRFLHHMIRYLVGTMVAVSEYRFSEENFLHLLYNPRKNVRIFKAPPQGLILSDIKYE